MNTERICPSARAVKPNCSPSLLPSLPPLQHPLQRRGEGLITVLSRNWSIFNSSGELTGTSTQWHLTVLSGLKAVWEVTTGGLSQTSVLTPNVLSMTRSFCSSISYHL